ncbi:MAG: hypothetical protein EXR69_11255 [Myxococcales bacterium]|nr:hypothetical protein [Myxococcales bacterium]
MLDPWVTGLAAETAAGSGVEALVDALCAGRPLATAAPWAWAGVPGHGVGAAVGGGCRGGGAEALLQAVVDAVDPGMACGLVVGTTSGSISGEFERDFPGVGIHDYRQRPTRAVVARCRARWLALWRLEGAAGGPHSGALGDPLPDTTVSVACASGAAAFDVARGWLRTGRCERVIVAGVDALSPFIHAGFAGIGALAAGPSHPFTAGRDGMMLGEGAAAVLLETPTSARRAGRRPLCALRGTGLSQDAVHLTAPDRTGGGLYRAMAAAVGDAGISLAHVGDALDAVSAHGTGTPFNDAMEARALARLFGDRAVPLHAAKPVVGHTLGAAGTVEAVALIAMLAGAEAPSAMQIDPELGVRGRARRRTGGFGLSVNAAFGGVNVALVFGPVDRSGPGDGNAAAGNAAAGNAAARAASVEVVGDTFPVSGLPRLPDGTAPLNLGRADSYVRAGILALARIGAQAGEAIVLASEESCAQADRRYLDALVRSGPERAPRVHFIYTIPGAPLAEAAILLGLNGPGLVLCDGPEAAQAEARRLVEEGRVLSAVALAITGPTVPQAGALTRAVATRYRAPE